MIVVELILRIHLCSSIQLSVTLFLIFFLRQETLKSEGAFILRKIFMPEFSVFELVFKSVHFIFSEISDGR